MKALNIIPYPRMVKTGGNIPPDHALYAKGGIRTNTSGFLPSYFHEKFACSINESKWDGGLFYFTVGPCPAPEELLLPDCLKGREEGYWLTIGKASALVAASSEKGLFYGVQTLRQLLSDGITYELEIIDWPQCLVRGFHLETRYGMPDYGRMLEIIDETAHYKFNTLLMEFEDKYPYKSAPHIAAENALTPEQLENLQRYAHDRFMEIIPLQQTLGHLEYVLKKDEYYPLREVREEGPRDGLPFSGGLLGPNHFNSIDEICISNEEAVRLVERLLDDAISLFPASRYIHIGCDEAWNLCCCGLCRERGEKNRLFTEHVNRMAGKVKAAGKTPVMWDDMLRHFNDAEMQLLDKDILLVCWLYYKYETGDAKTHIERYKSFGYQVLGASSAKCSAGLAADYFDIPDFSERTANIADWSGLADELELPGVITTVWSNYTGTIAPPHPFFETAWYPVLLSADMYWNREAGSDRNFESRFFANYFGAEMKDGVFQKNAEEVYRFFESLCRKPLRHAYTAEAYRWMYLLVLYRKKSLVTNRELYKLYSGVSNYEKAIVLKRTEDLASMRQYLKEGIYRLMRRHYSEEEVKEFLDSRFYTDDLLEAHKP